MFGVTQDVRFLLLEFQGKPLNESPALTFVNSLRLYFFAHLILILVWRILWTI